MEALTIPAVVRMSFRDGSICSFGIKKEDHI